MRLIVMLFWGFVLYFIFKAVVRFLRQIAQSGNLRERSNNNNNGRNSAVNNQDNEVNNRKYNINNKDIVDADFIEIKPEDEKKTENKQQRSE